MTGRFEASGREPEALPPAGFSRSRRVPLILLALGLVCAVAASGWWLMRPARTSRAPSASAPSQAEIADVMTVLQAHGRAVLAGDAAGWNAGLDPDPRSVEWVANQRQVIDNLRGVPLTVWRYSLVAPVTSADVIAPAATRLGARVVLVHVRLQYALARVDPQPTERDLWLTATRRGDRFTLAGDTDAGAVGGTSWHGPWDFGPLNILSGPHTLVLAHPAHRAESADFAALVEKSVPVVTRVWGPGWNTHVAILIPDSADEFAAVAGTPGNNHDLAAVSVADEIRPDGTVLGARVIMNPDNLARLDATGRRLVVQHELTHLASRAATSDQMPTWVIEGFADYVGNLSSGQPVRMAATELAQEVHGGQVPGQLPTTADFDGGNARLAQVYQESWLACRSIARRAGEQGLVRFYKAVSTAAVADPATATAVALRQILHSTVPQFTALWRADLIAELR